MSEQPNSVEVRIRLPGGAEDRLIARKVLVGAGPISSAALALTSGFVDEVRIQDTATAFTGVLATKSAPGIDGFHHSLAQWWIHDRDERLLAQIYPPSEQHAARLASRFPTNAALTAASRRLARHLHPVIAYLCQEESDPLIVRFHGRLIVAEPGANCARPRFEARLRALGKLFRRAGYWMPARAAEFPAAGTGYHMGASWPHGRRSDELGRLPGTRRIHFIDASVLPALPLGSITPTVMANAIRIARRASEDE